MNPTALLVPAAVLTVTLRVLRELDRPIVNVAVTVPGLTTTTLLADTPLPDMETVAGAVKFAPVIVTFTVVPRLAEFGAIELSTGFAAAVTLNGWAPLVPAEVETVTLCAPVAAPAAMVN